MATANQQSVNQMELDILLLEVSARKAASTLLTTLTLALTHEDIAPDDIQRLLSVSVFLLSVQQDDEQITHLDD